jgi:hypothetical protein
MITNPPVTALVSGYGPSVTVPRVSTMLALGGSTAPPEIHSPTINRDDVCETMPNPTDGRIRKRLYGRVGAREFHIILVVNPGDTLHTVTTVYEVDRKDFPDGRTRRRQR